MRKKYVTNTKVSTESTYSTYAGGLFAGGGAEAGLMNFRKWIIKRLSEINTL